MNRIPFLVTLLLSILIFADCKKELEDGGISFSFKARQPYQYTNFAVSVSYTRYGDPVMHATTINVTENIQLTPLKPGNYFWTATVQYTSAQVSGNYSFNGEIIIEKGKLMHITLED